MRLLCWKDESCYGKLSFVVLVVSVVFNNIPVVVNNNPSCSKICGICEICVSFCLKHLEYSDIIRTFAPKRGMDCCVHARCSVLY